jgi:cytochrome c-type biogenesis protein CcmF
MAEVGYAAELLAFVAAVYGIGAALVGAQEGYPELVKSARNAAVAVTALLSVACGVLLYLLVGGDFSVEYVAQTTNRSMSAFFKITALWGGQNGSILFWSWVLSLYVAPVAFSRRTRALFPYVIAVCLFVEAFFVGLNVFVANPFERLPFLPPDGTGLNPLLRHFGMAIHPPVLYAGFVGFTVPYAFALAALLTRQTGQDWLRLTHRWTLIAWMFLSMGLFLGMWWAYDVLGWGGYWGWDPVENAALIPWFVATSFLHSVIIQEKRGMLKVWNMVLVILTFCLVIFGTFLTRSGVISSVHAFAQSAVGPVFLAFIALVFFGSFALLITRLDSLRGENELDALFSRESAFLLSTLLFLSLAFATLWGSLFPLISEAFTGDKITVGPPFFNQVDGPLLAVLLLWVGICPLISWRQGSLRAVGRGLWKPLALAAVVVALLLALGVSRPVALLGFALCALAAVTTLGEFWRGMRIRRRLTSESQARALLKLLTGNRRRYGGYLVHLGVVLIAVGIIGSQTYQQQTQANLRPGESMSIGPYTLTYQGHRQRHSADDVLVTEAVLDVARDGRPAGTVRPSREFYFNFQQVMTIRAVLFNPPVNLREDLYVIFAGLDESGDSASFKVYVTPLIIWLWVGGFVFTFGTLFAAWPERVKHQMSIAKSQVSNVKYQVSKS